MYGHAPGGVYSNAAVNWNQAVNSNEVVKVIFNPMSNLYRNRIQNLMLEWTFKKAIESWSNCSSSGLLGLALQSESWQQSSILQHRFRWWSRSCSQTEIQLTQMLVAQCCFWSARSGQCHLSFIDFRASECSSNLTKLSYFTIVQFEECVSACTAPYEQEANVFAIKFSKKPRVTLSVNSVGKLMRKAFGAGFWKWYADAWEAAVAAWAYCFVGCRCSRQALINNS